MSLAPRIDRIEKNYFINGAMDYFQRGGSAGNPAVTISTSPSYVADRFKTGYTGTVTGSVTLVQISPATLPNAKSQSMAQFSARRNASTFQATLLQRVESIMMQELVAVGFASLSFWVFSPIAGATVQLILNEPTVQDNYTSVTQIATYTSPVIPTSTWSLVTFPAITIPSSASVGLEWNMNLLVPSGTDGSPVLYNFTQFMLNAGKEVSDFARCGRHIGEELLLCQRYYEQSYNPFVPPGTATTNGEIFHLAFDTNLATGVNWTVTKFRGADLILYSPVTGASGNVRDYVTNTDVPTSASIRSVTGFAFLNGVFSTHTVFFQWTADAEL